MIPHRLIEILKSCESKDKDGHHFPPTEVFNEGWMLRLVLDALQSMDVPGHPLKFADGANWYSEARLSSPFLRKPKKEIPGNEKDSLGEGYTNADGVIGHFAFVQGHKAKLKLSSNARQFIVVEAKMFSDLSSGTTNAPGYNQAARTVACMAEMIRQSEILLSSLESVGFYAVTAKSDKKLANSLKPKSIRDAVTKRIEAYTYVSPKQAQDLKQWEEEYLSPLVDRLENEQRLAVFSWEQMIKPIAASNKNVGEELQQFYDRCLKEGK